MPTIKITDATTEPLTLAEVKARLRIDHANDDADLGMLITACRLACEGELERTLLTTTWEMQTDAFSDALRLEFPRILSVASLKYLDTSGIEQTLNPSDYLVDMQSEPGWIVPAYGKSWPDTYGVPNAVRVRYTAGYGATADKVPADLKLWMHLHVGQYYRSREASVVGNIVTALPFHEGLLAPYRVRWV